jgi:hypothetical protein
MNSDWEKVYSESVKDYRKKSMARMNETHTAYSRLQKKDTVYAKSLAELLALHAKVYEVWRTAPDHLKDDERGNR